MKDIEFPLFKTKSPDGSPKFDLNDPVERKKYFEFKAGTEIAKIKAYLDGGNTFLAYLLGKKNAGKGTYTKLFGEIIGKDKIVHLSVGDLVRNLDEEVHDEEKRKALVEYLRKDYRGYINLDSVIEAQVNRTQGALLPTEFILSMIKREIGRVGRKAVFLDGFPRNMDQVSYSLFFRELVGYRDDPDIMVLIDLPQAVIDERIKTRVVCPVCHTPRSPKLALTKNIEYDEKEKKFYLVCEDPACKGARMTGKPGDELGIEAIRDRLEADEAMIARAFSLYGIPKVLLTNSIPLEQKDKYADDYEITPEYILKWNEVEKKVEVETKPWIINDDKGRPSVSYLPAPVVLSLIKQLADLL